MNDATMKNNDYFEKANFRSLSTGWISTAVDALGHGQAWREGRDLGDIQRQNPESPLGLHGITAWRYHRKVIANTGQGGIVLGHEYTRLAIGRGVAEAIVVSLAEEGGDA